mmetsp:Transcript_27412/g.49434  ORF Transcript_27412/g.49434 Transcript_27412/m.49434 type:complete len:245 (+) Transcript_27412:1949-2683(+)
MIPGLSSSSNPFFRVLLALLPPRLPLAPEVEAEFSLSVATRIHWRERVIPGVLAVRARLRPRRRLMSADFPTFGNPMIPTLKGRSFNPLLFLLSFTCLPALYTARVIACVPCPLLASTNNTSSTPSSPLPLLSLPSSYLLRSFFNCTFLFLSSPSNFSSHLSAPNRSYASRQVSRLFVVTVSTRVSTTTRGRPADHFPTEGWAVALGARASRTSMTTSTDFKVSESCRSALAMWPGYQLTLGRW